MVDPPVVRPEDVDRVRAARARDADLVAPGAAVDELPVVAGDPEAPPPGTFAAGAPAGIQSATLLLGLLDDPARRRRARPGRDARRARRRLYAPLHLMADPDLSVVVTLLNEQGSVEELYRRTVTALDGKPFELILVDDGSTDATWAAVERLHAPTRASAASASSATSASTRRCTPASRAPAARSS